MGMEEIMTYIRPELVILIPVLMLIGKAIKNASWIKDEGIPFILGTVSILITSIWVLAVTDVQGGWQHILGCVFDILVQGILLAGTATWGHQCYKQGTKMKDSEKDDDNPGA